MSGPLVPAWHWLRLQLPVAPSHWVIPKAPGGSQTGLSSSMSSADPPMPGLGSSWTISSVPPIHHHWGLGLRLIWALPLSPSHLTRHIQLLCALVSSPVKGPAMVPRGAWVLSTPLRTFLLQPPLPPCTKSPRGRQQSEVHPPPASVPVSLRYSAFPGLTNVPPKFTSTWNLRVGCYLEIGSLQL